MSNICEPLASRKLVKTGPTNCVFIALATAFLAVLTKKLNIAFRGHQPKTNSNNIDESTAEEVIMGLDVKEGAAGHSVPKQDEVLWS